MCVMQRKIVTKTKLQNCCACHAICDKNKTFSFIYKKKKDFVIRNVIIIVIENVVILEGKSHQF